MDGTREIKNTLDTRLNSRWGFIEIDGDKYWAADILRELRWDDYINLFASVASEVSRGG